MSRILAILVLTCLVASGQTVNVTWNFTDYTGNPQAVSKFTLTPSQKAVGQNGTNILIPFPVSAVTGLTGSVVMSNVVTGYFYIGSLLDVTGLPVAKFTNFFPTNISGNINASSYLTNFVPVTYGFSSLEAGTNIILTTNNGELFINTTAATNGLTNASAFATSTNAVIHTGATITNLDTSYLTLSGDGFGNAYLDMVSGDGLMHFGAGQGSVFPLDVNRTNGDLYVGIANTVTILSGNITAPKTITASNFVGAVSGNGGNLTNLAATNLTGTITASATNAVVHGDILASNLVVNSSVQVNTGSFIGDGGNLTNLNPMGAFSNNTHNGLTFPTNVFPLLLPSLAASNGMGLTNIATQSNSIWVSPSGNNSSAMRGTLNAFQTLSAAKDAAQSGDVIFVTPGNYVSGTNLAKNNVTWNYLGGRGCIVSNFASNAIAGSIQPMYSDQDGATNFTVNGNPIFIYNTGTEPYNPVFSGKGKGIQGVWASNAVAMIQITNPATIATLNIAEIDWYSFCGQQVSTTVSPIIVSNCNLVNLHIGNMINENFGITNFQTVAGIGTNLPFIGQTSGVIWFLGNVNLSFDRIGQFEQYGIWGEEPVSGNPFTNNLYVKGSELDTKIYVAAIDNTYRSWFEINWINCSNSASGAAVAFYGGFNYLSAQKISDSVVGCVTVSQGGTLWLNAQKMESPSSWITNDSSTPSNTIFANVLEFIDSGGMQSGAGIVLSGGTNIIIGSIVSTNSSSLITLSGGRSSFQGAVNGVPLYTNNFSSIGYQSNIFYGNGSGLTNLTKATSSTFGVVEVDNSTITASGGVISIASVLLTNMPTLNGTNALTNTGNTFVGNGNGLTGLTGANVTGTIPQSSLPSNVITNNWQAASGAISLSNNVTTTGNIAAVQGTFTNIIIAGTGNAAIVGGNSGNDVVIKASGAGDAYDFAVNQLIFGNWNSGGSNLVYGKSQSGNANRTGMHFTIAPGQSTGNGAPSGLRFLVDGPSTNTSTASNPWVVAATLDNSNGVQMLLPVTLNGQLTNNTVRSTTQGWYTTAGTAVTNNTRALDVTINFQVVSGAGTGTAGAVVQTNAFDSSVETNLFGTGGLTALVVSYTNCWKGTVYSNDIVNILTTTGTTTVLSSFSKPH